MHRHSQRGLNDRVLLKNQGLERPLGGVLSLEVLCVETSGLFLHLLQGRHVFLSRPEDVGEGLRIKGWGGAWDARRLGNRVGGALTGVWMAGIEAVSTSLRWTELWAAWV